MNNIQNIIDDNNLNLGPAYEPYLQSKQDENFNITVVFTEKFLLRS